MPTDIEPSPTVSSPGVNKPFAYFLAGLAVGAICVLLPFLCILPLALHQARVSDGLQLQLNLKESELANYKQQQMQHRPPPPPDSRFPPSGYPPPPPQGSPEGPFTAAPDMP